MTVMISIWKATFSEDKSFIIKPFIVRTLLVFEFNCVNSILKSSNEPPWAYAAASKIQLIESILKFWNQNVYQSFPWFDWRSTMSPEVIFVICKTLTEKGSPSETFPKNKSLVHEISKPILRKINPFFILIIKFLLQFPQNF